VFITTILRELASQNKTKQDKTKKNEKYAKHSAMQV
jgi:hypothetical protein